MIAIPVSKNEQIRNTRPKSPVKTGTKNLSHVSTETPQDPIKSPVEQHKTAYLKNHTIKTASRYISSWLDESKWK